MAQQARDIAMFFDAEQQKPTHLIRDLDSKFTQQVDAILASEGIEAVPVGPRDPDLNAFAERFVLSLKSACLDHFAFFGEKHPRHCISEFLTHYHQERPHQGLGNRPLGQEGSPEPVTPRLEEVVREERLGGLLSHYRRAA
jgi:putative transposase